MESAKSRAMSPKKWPQYYKLPRVSTRPLQSSTDMSFVAEEGHERPGPHDGLFLCNAGETRSLPNVGTPITDPAHERALRTLTTPHICDHPAPSAGCSSMDVIVVVVAALSLTKCHTRFDRLPRAEGAPAQLRRRQGKDRECLARERGEGCDVSTCAFAAYLFEHPDYGGHPRAPRTPE